MIDLRLMSDEALIRQVRGSNSMYRLCTRFQDYKTIQSILETKYKYNERQRSTFTVLLESGKI